MSTSVYGTGVTDTTALLTLHFYWRMLVTLPTEPNVSGHTVRTFAQSLIVEVCATFVWPRVDH